MKVHEQTPDADLLCQESLSLLSLKIRAFLNSQYPDTEIWFPDDTTQWQKALKADHKVHVVLYGNLLRAIAEIPFWPGQSVVLWVLSEASKSALVKILGLKDQDVSVIPRSIFNINTNLENQISKNLVYAGRLSRQKNILDLIYTLYFLQHEHSAQYNLTLFGSFDDEYNQDCGRMLFKESFQNEVTKLVAQLDWKQAPRFEGKKDSLEWPKLLSSKMTLISLSRFLMEDFGVSIAQAHEEGISTITSEWGGYKDIQFKNHFRLHSHFLSSDTTPLGMRLSLARQLAKCIAEKQFVSANKEVNKSINKPTTITKEYLNKLHINLLQITGPKLALLSRDQLAVFSDTLEGKKLIKIIHDEFETKSENEIFIIVSSLGELSLVENQQLFCELEKNQGKKTKYSLIESSQATQKWALSLLLKSENVLVTETALKAYPQLGENLKKIVSDFRVISETLELPLQFNEIYSIEK